MKNRLIITISDIKGTKSYNIHQLFKKFIIFFSILIMLLLGGSFLFISYLTTQLDEIKKAKETQLKILSEKEEKLLTQNKLYSMQIDSKVKDIEELSSKLDEINTIIGINENDTTEEITKKTLEAIDTNYKKFTLKLIPNGRPLDNISIS